MLMTDQQRWDAMGSVNPALPTPCLDGLAARGLRFTEAVCQAPLCVPSRISLMTGLYPCQLGLGGNDDPTPGDQDVPSVWLPEMLRRAGYTTAGFGKTHWGHSRTPASTRGFETRVVGCREVGQEIGVTRWQDEDDPEGLSNYRQEVQSYGPGEEGAEGYLGTDSRVPAGQHRDGWVADQALRWLATASLDPKRPLFFYLSFLKPHAGLNAPPEFARRIEAGKIRLPDQPPWSQEMQTHLGALERASSFHRGRYEQWRRAFVAGGESALRATILRYYANCAWLDDLFGRVLQNLRKIGRLENALIIFLSDHGELLGERNFRFSKYCLYESSVRVPLVIAGSALPHSLRGTSTDRLVELIDIYPTLAAVAGIPAPALAQGRDLLDSSDPRKGGFSEMNIEGISAVMWRDKRHKLIRFQEAGSETVREEFYDISKDPGEWYNLDGRKETSLRQNLLRSRLLRKLSSLPRFNILP